MNKDTNRNNEISDITKNREQLWQELANCTIENPEYRELCNTLLTPVISDLKKNQLSEYYQPGYVINDFVPL
ncbi:hypothetical protein RG393_003539 [Morganella morganii]|nr:hypothetical protein [Morganella morganii]